MKTQELFLAEEVAMDSLRLAWMKKHRIETAAMEPELVGTTSPETGDEIAPWIAWIERIHGELPGPVNVVTGETEDEALANLARKFRLKLWNEELSPNDQDQQRRAPGSNS